MRALRYGCVGNDVRYLQYLLNEATPDIPPIEIDGHFGGLTKQRVEVYQKRRKLEADGSVGPITQKSLNLSEYMVFILNPSKCKIWVAGTPYGSESYPLRTLKQWAQLEKADLVFNLALFNIKGVGRDQYGPIKGRTITYCRGKGKDIGYGGTAEKVRINSDNVFAGAKVAISNGYTKSVLTSDKRARNANGVLKDGSIFVVQTLSKVTEYQLMRYMYLNYNVDLMLIQDAGGSTGFYATKYDSLIACEKEGKNGRPVATTLCVSK